MKKSKLKNEMCKQLIGGGGIAPTITENHGQVTAITEIMKEQNKGTNLITEDGNIRRYVGSDVIDQFNPYQAGYINYPNGYGHGTRVSDIAFTLATVGTQQITKEQEARYEN